MKNHPVDGQTAAERKDLLPWPIKTRKRGSRCAASPTWTFTDLPPKKRILLPPQARRVCVICGRVFEDYDAFGDHKSHHGNKDFRHCKVLDINEVPLLYDGQEETLP